MWKNWNPSSTCYKDKIVHHFGKPFDKGFNIKLPLMTQQFHVYVYTQNK